MRSRGNFAHYTTRTLCCWTRPRKEKPYGRKEEMVSGFKEYGFHVASGAATIEAGRCMEDERI